MELEEAIQTLKDFAKYGRYYSNNTEHHMKTAINTVLKHLTKQEKMIELMAEHISFGKDIQKILCSPKVHGKDDCIGITCKRCIKEYFEKKAEESE